MPLGKGNVHIDKPLSDFALMYMQDEKNMIATKIAPMLKTDKQSDKYFTFDRGNWRATDSERQSTSLANRANVPRPSNDSFYANQYALVDYIGRDEQEIADDPLQPKQDATSYLVEQLLLGREINAAKVLFTTTACGSSATLSTTVQWSYTNTTTPLDDVDLGIDSVEQAIGKTPNTGVCGKAVMSVLKRHAQILDLIKYTQKGVVSEDLVASLFDFDNLYVGRAVQMTTDEGISSEAVAFIWGKDFLVSYVNNGRASKKVISQAYHFSQKGEQPEVRSWYDEARDADAVEPRLFYDLKVTCSLCGYIIKTAVA